MKLRFANKHLEILFTTGKGQGKYPPEVAKKFVQRVQFIQTAVDERDLRAMKGFNFEKLKGNKKSYSIRLTKSWRMIFKFEKLENGKTVVIIEINNHYGD